MSVRAWCLFIGIAIVCSLGLGAQTPPLSTSNLLDRYAGGQFDAVVAALEAQDDFAQILKDLKERGDEWIAAGGEANRSRRELAAATFALEAARVDVWREWKWLQEPPPGVPKLPILHWWAPPLLIEWGCERFRSDESPRPIERVWQLAALAVAARSEDTQFLIGFTELEGSSDLPPGLPLHIRLIREKWLRDRGIEVFNPQLEIGHLNHVMARFPMETRFVLGQAIARERDFPDDAMKVYAALEPDAAVGAEALTRLAALQLRANRPAEALASLDKAERLTRDSYVLYLARLYRGMTLQRLRRDADAIAAYRGALAVRPATESASVRLAELLFKADNRAGARSVMADVLAHDAGVVDPYLTTAHGDDRFWPELIARLRREIKP